MNTARSVAIWLGYQHTQNEKAKGIDWPGFCNLLEKSGYTDDTIDDDTPISDEIIFRALLNTRKGQAKTNRDQVIDHNLVPLLKQGKLPDVSGLINSIPNIELPKKAPKKKKEKAPTIMQPPEEAEE